MAFTPAPVRTPIGIGDISIVLLDSVAAGDEPATQGARFEVQVIYDDGSIIVEQGNYVPHIDAATISGLQAMLADARVKSVDGFLP